MVHLNKKRLRQAKGCRRRFPLFCAESAGTLLAPQKKTLYFFAGFRYTETNGRKQSL